MNSIYIDETAHWLLYYDNPSYLFTLDQKGISEQVIHYASCLRSVKIVFDEWYGSSCVNTRSPLSVLYTHEAPETFRQSNLIVLSARYPFALQIIYQFAHELFHFMLAKDICKQYRWLEENLAELSSLLVLRKIYDNSQQHPWLANYIPSIPQYIQGSQNKAVAHTLGSTAAFISANS